MRNSYSSFNY